MNTPCPRTDALSALIDDELSAPERDTLQAHLRGCAICAATLAELNELHACFAALPLATPAFDVTPDVMRRIGASAAKRPRGRQRRPWWQLAMLAPAGAAALTGGLWLGAVLMPSTLVGVRIPAAQMAAFSALPPGVICPAPQACGGAPR